MRATQPDSRATPAARPARRRAVGRAEPGDRTGSVGPGRLSPEALSCPRCHSGTLITGARGWGCSRWREGCGFVVWFETFGRRLTLAQLRDLVVRGRTRKARFGARTGSVVLDGETLRFEAAETAAER